MIEPNNRKPRPEREPPVDAPRPAPDTDKGKVRSRLAEKSEAHRRWIADDSDDGACRGID